LTFGTLSPNTVNQTANNDPLTLNNTGNVAIANGSIQVNGTNLAGETDSNKALYANNFSFGYATGSNVECNAVNSTPLNKSVFKYIELINLTRGNNSINDNVTGQEQMYLCLKVVGAEISGQSYSTSNQGAWTIKIAVTALALRSLRKRKKKVQDSKLTQALDLIIEEIKEKHSLSRKETVEFVLQELKEKYNMSAQELLDSLSIGDKNAIPVNIFSSDLGALEAMCKYLKENESLTYHEIAILLQRDDRTIWTAYKKASEKQKEPIKAEKAEVYIPMDIFANGELTILESVIIYLKDNDYNYADIARLLERDQRNIWTTYARAIKKIKK
jgi:DNA-directed RNA polymerase specialized sigma24 family protein